MCANTVQQLAAKAVPWVRTAADTRDARPEPPDEGQRQVPDWVRRLRDWQPSTGEPPQLPDIVQAVRGLIRAGKVGALVAAGGTGKTTLLLILAVCHANGLPFFGMEVLEGTFVLLSNDDPLEDLQRALELVMEAMGLNAREKVQARRRVRLHSLQGEAGTKAFTESISGSVVSTGLQDLVLEALGPIPDLVGIAIDTLRQFSGGSSNDEQVINITIAGATEIALRTGAYVIVCHHTGKQNYRDGVQDQYCGSGSAAIADNCRFVLLLQTTTWTDIESKVQRTGQERGDPLVLLSTRGSLLMKPAEPIFLHRHDYFIGRVAGAVMTKDQQVDERDRKILRAIRRGAQTKTAIALVVGGKKSVVIDRVDDLEARGLIRNERSQSGSRIKAEFVVTTAGSAFLEASDD